MFKNFWCAIFHHRYVKHYSGDWKFMHCDKCKITWPEPWRLEVHALRQMQDHLAGATPMRIWFDTEFIEDGKTIDLISIGMVREDGAVLYFENRECNFARASDWVKENVLPHITSAEDVWRSRAEIADAIVTFAGEKPEIWAYYADYDWVVLCQLYGTMMNLPKGWPMYCRDVKQLCDSFGNPPLTKQEEGSEHNALADAIWTKKAWEFLQSEAANKFL